jgi:hypothetical protein
MLSALLSATLLCAGPAAMAMDEPDGSRTVGVVAPFQADPPPPPWLRTTSHALAALDCRHYEYEAYGDERGGWLVRYVNFPETGEAFREIEQVFLFPPGGGKMQELKVSDVRFEPKAALHRGRTFPLVDRRDLLRPE